MRLRILIAVAGLALAATAASAAVLVLTSGDRYTGKITLRGKKTIRLRTPYGTVTVPRTAIERVIEDDGTEVVINAPPSPPPTPPPAPPGLELEVRGDAFWYAWDPRSAPSDTRLALQLQLDDRVLATWTDPELDAGEIRGALVNAFAYGPSLVVTTAEGVTAGPVDTTGGRARLGLALPPGTSGGTLRLAYLAQPTVADGQHFAVTSTTLPVELAPGRITLVRIQQDRGRMEWSRRSVRQAETFRLGAVAEPPAAP